MRILTNPLKYLGPGTVIALGTFDGVHIGHQALIRTAVQEAHARGLEATVCTFDRHPLKLLAPENAPEAMLTQEEKLQRFERLGADIALILPFTLDLAQVSPEEFLTGLIRDMRAQAVVAGENYTFGHLGRGDSALLKRLAPEYDCRAIIVPPVLDAGQPVSSTRIRQALREGDTEAAARMLGKL